MDERHLNIYFGHTTHTKAAYLLFYQAVGEEKDVKYASSFISEERRPDQTR